jgi:hypothetical protein
MCSQKSEAVDDLKKLGKYTLDGMGRTQVL